MNYELRGLFRRAGIGPNLLHGTGRSAVVFAGRFVYYGLSQMEPAFCAVGCIKNADRNDLKDSAYRSYQGCDNFVCGRFAIPPIVPRR